MVSFFIAIYVYVGLFGFVDVISALAGITFALGEIMVGIDTLGSTACRPNYTCFEADISVILSFTSISILQGSKVKRST